MVDLLHLEELRGFLLSERDSGILVQIPPDLYQTTATLIRTLQQEVIIMDDPFSDEAHNLIEKVASIRETAEELFQLRSEKIVDLARSQAEGSYIDRDKLRTLIPAEMEMFNLIVEGIRVCRSSLIEWRVGGGTTRLQPSIKVESPHRISEIGELSSPVPAGGEVAEQDSLMPEDSGIVSGQESKTDSLERAYEQNEGWTPSDEEEEEPFPYTLVRVKADMETFMGVDGRTYELMTGDIITLPRRNAEVLAERDIVLNINPG